MNKEFNVVGMTCNGCVRHVTKALEGVEGVENVAIYLESGRTEVSMKQDIADAVLVSAIQEAGYSVQ